MNLPALPQDKANHFVYGSLIALAFLLAGRWFYPQVAAWIALSGVCFFGLGKEISDWWQNRKGGTHGVELLDAVATIAGGLPVVIAALIHAKIA